MWARPHQTWWGPPPISEIGCPIGVGVGQVNFESI